MKKKNDFGGDEHKIKEKMSDIFRDMAEEEEIPEPDLSFWMIKVPDARQRWIRESSVTGAGNVLKISAGRRRYSVQSEACSSCPAA